MLAAVPTGWILISYLFFPNETTTKSDIVLAVIGVVGAVFTIAIAVFKMVQTKDKEKSEDLIRENYDGLHSALQVIHSLLRHKKGFDRKATDRLRITLHRIIKPKDGDGGPEHFEQLFDYVGANGKEGKGRTFSIRSGITGKAAREKDVFVGSRNNVDYQAYIRELITDWGYTEADAKKVSSTRNSFMAVPIKYRGQEVTGVIYLDSSEKDFFDDDSVKTLIVWACAGLAVFIDERYN